MKAFYCHHFELPLPEGHRFPMAKYRLLHARVQAAAAGLDIELHVPEPVSEQALLRVHAPDYIERMLGGRMSDAEMRRIGFPWSPAMVERSRRSAGGSIAAMAAAMDEGVAVNLAGGTHHAAHARGGGYCVFNDAVIAAREAQATGRLRRILIVDLDVHQGDGTAALCTDDPSIYTFSMHAARNYPAIKPASDRDIALADGTTDAEYLGQLAHALPEVIAAARADAIIYLAGADPYIGDRLGYLSLSMAGLAERDRLVLDAAARYELPVAIAMAGGYAEPVEDIVDIHFNTVRAAAQAARRRTLQDSSSAH